MRALTSLTLIALLGTLSACDTAPPRPAPASEPTYEEARNLPLRSANYAAADELVRLAGLTTASATSNHANTGGTLIVATLASIDALEQSSTLGRFVSEQVASRLSQTGLSVVDLKVRNGIYMKRNEGEFMLTREIRDVAAAHKAQGVIVGTYAESANFVHITLKLVDPATSLVRAAYDYSLPLDKQVKSMIRR